MSSRERTLAIVLIGLIVLCAGGAGGYLFAYQPMRAKQVASAKLRADIQKLEEKMDQWRANAPRLAVDRKRSLPADPALARREYGEMLTRLLTRAHVPLGFRVVERSTDTTGIPQLAAKKPAYTRVSFEITFDKADLWAVQDFLTAYYKLDLLHQITALEIKTGDGVGTARGKAAPTDRKDLSVKLTTEAIILDGAEPRRTLLPVSNAFAAVGGLPGFHAVAFSPEIGRWLTPLQLTPVLAVPPRDYTLIVQKDIFHGPLPLPTAMAIGRIADVSATPEEPIPPVKVPLTADLAYTGAITLTATAEGSLLTSGSVEVNPADRTLTITPPDGATGSATITVIAKAERGQEAKTTFRVSIQPPPVAEKEKEDISGAILLIAVSTRSDGTAFATVRDNANKLKYEIEATVKGVEVTKFFYVRDQKKKDRDYETPKELVISDETSSTNRHFQVVTVAEDGLYLTETKKNPAAIAPHPKPMDRRGGRFPGGRGGERPGEGRADPVAAVVGLAASTPPPAPPTLYHWTTGRSLKALIEVPKDEAKKILQHAAETGPVGTAIVISRCRAACPPVPLSIPIAADY